ncbi:MAG: SDR family oxidoreductase, partial [Opitutaceae bacterium]|nr:SDR family oxidoreductase [Verrucomicrobiales bacterium]
MTDLPPPRVVWITGAGGLIGSHLLKTAPSFAPHVRAVGLTRHDVDLTDFTTVRQRFLSDRPAAVIHCAALSKTTTCQADPDLARLINIDATRHLAELAAEIPLLFFSTDLVFDGSKGNYVETDLVNPLSVYAETKVIGEQLVLANPRHTVLRTSLNFGYTTGGNRAFNEEMVQAWRSGRTLNLFVDEFRNPIAASVTARAVWELLYLNRPGLYHLAGSERLSR